jgi:hypothetical protein
VADTVQVRAIEVHYCQLTLAGVGASLLRLASKGETMVSARYKGKPLVAPGLLGLRYERPCLWTSEEPNKPLLGTLLQRKLHASRATRARNAAKNAGFRRIRIMF